ncbi:MAG TPA: PEP-CTERM sorting domain-containing protein [Candidatus Binatia bacterium]|nr:PEP-CTERM sorting domain-containing protein [Candidatus Binatia bacterium]
MRLLIAFGAAALLLGASAALAFPPIDLTTSGTTYASADGTIWTQLVNSPTGTGVYSPFERLQANGVEEGMNTSGDAHVTYDDVAGTWTHAIQLNQLATVTVGSTSYYSFSLDINEANGGGKQFLSLDELRLYTLAGNGSLTSTADVVSAGGVLRYNLDGTTDQTVYMDYSLAAGSGHDDIQVLIPTSYFAGASSTDYLYFYNKMGATTGMEADFTSDAGFEEWHGLLGTTNPPPTNLPEPSGVVLIGTGILGILATRQRRK